MRVCVCVGGGGGLDPDPFGPGLSQANRFPRGGSMRATILITLSKFF